MWMHQPSQDFESVGWGSWREKIRDCVGGASRTSQKLCRPFGDAFFPHMTIVSGLRLSDVLNLPDECQWLLCALQTLGGNACFSIRCVGIVIIAPVVIVRSS